MSSTANVLEEARALVQKRLADLDDERKRLERALAELGGKAAVLAGSPPWEQINFTGRSTRARSRPGANAANAVAAPVPIRPWS